MIKKSAMKPPKTTTTSGPACLEDDARNMERQDRVVEQRPQPRRAAISDKLAISEGLGVRALTASRARDRTHDRDPRP